MVSIFERFKRKRLDGYEEKNTDDMSQEITKEPEPKTTDGTKTGTANGKKPVEKLLKDIWATREQYPGDMQAIEFFLPALRDRLETHETKRQAVEALAMRSEGDVIRDEAGMPVEIKPVDARCTVYVTSDKMAAYICIFPPIAGGAEISLEIIMDTLKEAKVSYGIDQEKINEVAEEKIYGVLFAVARGLPHTNGEDGEVIDHYPRQQDVGLKEDERGNVDHKSLHRFQGILEGDVICEIIPPTEGEDGIDVTGKTLKAKAGRVPKVPQGKNTVLSEDGSKLVATMDGDISFRNGGFCVERLLTISESVDNAVGNLDYNGDILIKGDVKSGFRVCATGDIIVQGMVAGATLSAGGNIEIAKGMNGNEQGVLEAHGNIKLSFMENTNVICHQNVYASTIINSNITCGGSVIVKEGKGILIGGSIVAGVSVEAKRIGNQSGCENVIKIGHSMSDEENLEYLSKQLKENKDTLDKIQKNINYLQGKPSLPADKQELLEKLQVQSVLYIDKLDAISEKLEKLENARPDFSKCRVCSDTIYPMTKISLDYAKLTVRETTSMCTVYYEDGELIMGSF